MLHSCTLSIEKGAVVVVWSLDLQLYVQSVPITNKVVSSNPAHGEIFSIQYYVIRFFSDMWWFFPGIPVSANNKTANSQDIAEILLKVALSAIKHKPISKNTTILTSKYIHYTKSSDV